ncbi:MAG: HAD family phosphatase [Chloroflexi bacterium]|nr:HAD family phosphatase [Chloroflexota bacterium]
MIQAILFDVGGVLLRTEDHTYRRTWEKKLGLKPWESETIVFNSEMGTKAQQGKISDDELWLWVGNHIGLTDDQLKTFRHDFWAGDVLDNALVDLIRGLHGRYQTAIISNYNDSLRPIVTHKFKIADAFDEIIISCEEGIMKPDPQIYQTALSRLGRKPEETVFIDDFAHNVEAAQALGMHAIHFTPQLNFAASLTDLGIALPGEEK